MSRISAVREAERVFSDRLVLAVLDAVRQVAPNLHIRVCDENSIHITTQSGATVYIDLVGRDM